MKRLFLAAIATLFSANFANALTVEVMGHKTSLELFNEISASCTVIIEGQSQSLQEVRDNPAGGIHQLFFITDAAEREDGVFASVQLEFQSFEKAKNSNVHRAFKLLSVGLRAENARSWGNTSVSGDSIKTTDIVVSALTQRSIELEAKAWVGEKRVAVAKLHCDPTSWVKTSDR